REKVTPMSCNAPTDKENNSHTILPSDVVPSPKAAPRIRKAQKRKRSSSIVTDFFDNSAAEEEQSGIEALEAEPSAKSDVGLAELTDVRTIEKDDFVLVKYDDCSARGKVFYVG